MSVIRSFIAVDIPKETRELCAELSDELARLVPRGLKFTGDFHITTHFLGNIVRADAEKIAASIQGNLPDKIEFRIISLDCFPHAGNPRVIVLKIESGSIKKIKKTVDEILFNDYNIKPEEREFKPHITLARVTFKTNELKNAVLSKPLNIETSYSQSISLYKSELTPQGPLYSVIAKLNKNNDDQHR